MDTAGHTTLAEELRTVLVGRNVLDGRWTFQIVEEYDAVYWGAVRAFLVHALGDLTDGREHVHESEMKDRRRSDGVPGHERRPS